MVAIMTEKNDEKDGGDKRRGDSAIVLDEENFKSHVGEERPNSNRATFPTYGKSASNPALTATTAVLSVPSNLSTYVGHLPIVRPQIRGDDVINGRKDAFVFKTPEKPAKRSKSQSKSPRNAIKNAAHSTDDTFSDCLPSTSSSAFSSRQFSSTPSGSSKRSAEVSPLKWSPIIDVGVRSASPPVVNFVKPVTSKRRIIVDRVRVGALGYDVRSSSNTDVASSSNRELLQSPDALRGSPTQSKEENRSRTTDFPVDSIPSSMTSASASTETLSNWELPAPIPSIKEGTTNQGEPSIPLPSNPQDASALSPLDEDKSSSRQSSDGELSASEDEDEEEAGLKIVELDNDPELEENINDCADRNNLGIRNIKQILKYVIRNKDVLEMVSSDMEQRTVESGTALTFEPKMTRARTKQAFHSGKISSDSEAPWIALTTPKKNKNPTFTELDLNDDEEDEDFDPNNAEEEEEDDDDMDSLFSMSSVASPIPTTLAPLACTGESKAFVELTSNGSGAADPEKDAPAKRTRQNLCLKDKPLEVLEKDLVVDADVDVDADVEPEMFDSATDDDADSEYRDFLREFYTKPTTALPPVATASEAEASEREDDDPDYNIFDDMDQDIEADPEEYQQRKVTKKELDELLSELFDGSNDEDDDTMDFPCQNFVLPPPSPPPAPPTVSRNKKTCTAKNDSSLSSNKKPAKVRSSKPAYSDESHCGVAPVAQTSAMVRETIFDPVNLSSLTSIQVRSPTRSATLSTPSPPLILPAIDPSIENYVADTVTSDCPSTAIDDSTPQSITSPPSVSSPWPSEELRRLLQQQMRQHVQLLTQSFVMCKTCAKTEEVEFMAEEAKMLVNELYTFSSQNAKASTFGDIANLAPAVEAVNDLAHLQLTSDSREEVSAIRKAFMHDCEIPSESHIGRKMTASMPPLNAMRFFMMVPAFPYPSLLPEAHISSSKSKDRKKRGERKKNVKDGGEELSDFDSVSGVDRNWFCRSEDNLIAIGWLQYMEMKVPKTEAVRGIQKLLLPHRTADQLQIKIKNLLAARSQAMSAVKYVKMHQQLPPSLNVADAAIAPTYFSYGSLSSTELNGLIAWYPKYKEALTVFDEKFASSILPHRRPSPPKRRLPLYASSLSQMASPVASPTPFIQQHQSSQSDFFAPSRGDVFGATSVILIPSTSASTSSNVYIPISSNFEATAATTTLVASVATPVVTSLSPSSSAASATDAVPSSVASTSKNASMTRPNKRTRPSEEDFDSLQDAFVTPTKRKRIRITPLEGAEALPPSTSIDSTPLPLSGVAVSTVTPAPDLTTADSAGGINGNRSGTQMMDDLLKVAMEEADIDAAAAACSPSPFKFLFTDSPYKTPHKTPLKTPPRGSPLIATVTATTTTTTTTSPMSFLGSLATLLPSASQAQVDDHPLNPADSHPFYTPHKRVSDKRDDDICSRSRSNDFFVKAKDDYVDVARRVDGFSATASLSYPLMSVASSSCSQTPATTSAAGDFDSVDARSGLVDRSEEVANADRNSLPSGKDAREQQQQRQNTSVFPHPVREVNVAVDATTARDSRQSLVSSDVGISQTPDLENPEESSGTEIEVFAPSVTTFALDARPAVDSGEHETSDKSTMRGGKLSRQDHRFDQPDLGVGSGASSPTSADAASALASLSAEAGAHVTPAKASTGTSSLTPASKLNLERSFHSPPSFYSGSGADSPPSSQISLEESFSDRTSYASDNLETPFKSGSCPGSDLETPFKGHIESSREFSPFRASSIGQSPLLSSPSSRTRHLPSLSLSRVSLMNSPSSKQMLQTKTPLKKIAPKELPPSSEPALSTAIPTSASSSRSIRPILPKIADSSSAETKEKAKNASSRNKRKILKLKPAKLSEFRKITPKPICQDANRMPAEVFNALENDYQEEMNSGAASVFAGIGEDLDLDQLMAASTTTNFTPSAHGGIESGAASALKSGATKKRSTLGGGGGGGATISGLPNAEEILRNMSDPNILENDPLSDERNAAYASAYLAKIRDTVGSENLEVYHAVLGLLRQCAEEGDPVKLFSQLKAVLGQRWPNLIDEFVPFLRPEQAIACGVLLPYSHHVRVKRFFRKCEIFFSRRPSNYATLIKAFHQFSNKSMDSHLFTEVFNTVLPLLKGQKDLIQEFLSFFPNVRNVHAVPTDADVFEQVTLDGSEDEDDEEDEDYEDADDRVGRYLPDENGIVWEHVELEMDEESDRIHGSRKCPCRCHTASDAPQQFQNRLRHCVPCAKIIVNGRYYIRTSAKQKEEADIVYIHHGRTQPLDDADAPSTGDRRDNKENENPRDKEVEGESPNVGDEATTRTNVEIVHADSVSYGESGSTTPAAAQSSFISDSGMASMMTTTTVTTTTTNETIGAFISISDSEGLSGVVGGGDSLSPDNESIVFTVAAGKAPVLTVSSAESGATMAPALVETGANSRTTTDDRETNVVDQSLNGGRPLGRDSIAVPRSNVSEDEKFSSSLPTNAVPLRAERGSESRCLPESKQKSEERKFPPNVSDASAGQGKLSSESDAPTQLPQNDPHLNQKKNSSPAIITAGTPAKKEVAWTHEMDVTLLQRCQSEGPSTITFEKFVTNFNSAFSDCGAISDSVKCVEERLLFLMEKLEAMQDGETSGSGEEDGEDDEDDEEEEEEEEEEDDNDDDGD